MYVKIPQLSGSIPLLATIFFTNFFPVIFFSFVFIRP
jgi:hypothetical protein